MVLAYLLDPLANRIGATRNEQAPGSARHHGLRRPSRLVCRESAGLELAAAAETSKAPSGGITVGLQSSNTRFEGLPRSSPAVDDVEPDDLKELEKCCYSSGESSRKRSRAEGCQGLSASTQQNLHRLHDRGLRIAKTIILQPSRIRGELLGVKYRSAMFAAVVTDGEVAGRGPACSSRQGHRVRLFCCAARVWSWHKPAVSICGVMSAADGS
jgi:hypothetical protein